MSRRPAAIILLAMALVLIMLLNGAWLYSYQEEQPSQSPHNGSGSPSEGSEVQPEKPPQVDPEADKTLFDHGTKDSGQQQGKVPEYHFSTSKVQAPEATPTTTPSSDALSGVLSSEKINWSQFAYIQYVTATEHVCNSVMAFESLHRLHSKADRVLLYPQEWGPVDGPTWKALDLGATTLLVKIRDEYHVKLRPVKLIRERGQERV